MGKVLSSSYDFGGGVVGTVVDSSGECSQEEIDRAFTLGIEIMPKLLEIAMMHLDEFTPEEREFVKLVWEDLMEEETDE